MDIGNPIEELDVVPEEIPALDVPTTIPEKVAVPA